MMITKSSKQWAKWALFNIIIVALYGSLMRYKIAYDFPFFNQKFLLHAHSHFAFAAWVSHALYSGIALISSSYLDENRLKKYNAVIIFNLICGFGMLFAFTAQGYKAVSIGFSTLSIVVSIWYAVIFYGDWNKLRLARFRPWAMAGLLLNIVAAAGPLYLAYSMATKTVTPNSYLGSIYYYLHFQYSGWFFFGAMALIMNILPKDFPTLKRYFNVFVITAIPTFFLSILWAKLPTWIYVITVIATMAQLIAWLILIKKFIPYFWRKSTSPQLSWVNIFLYVAVFAMTIKFILQAISVIPSLSQLVFGLRPIVIAYLHLVLLGVYSLFIIGYYFLTGLMKINKLAKFASFGFLVGVFLNEAFLGVQGFAGFFYIPIPHVNGLLFVAAITLFTSALLMFVSQFVGGKREEIE